MNDLGVKYDYGRRATEHEAEAERWYNKADELRATTS